MSADDILGAVAVLNPGALDRARRLACAVALLRSGTVAKEARRILRERHACDRQEAWRIVEMALDMAGPVEQQR